MMSNEYLWSTLLMNMLNESTLMSSASNRCMPNIPFSLIVFLKTIHYGPHAKTLTSSLKASQLLKSSMNVRHKHRGTQSRYGSALPKTFPRAST